MCASIVEPYFCEGSIQLKQQVQTDEIASCKLDSDYWDSNIRQLIFYKRCDREPKFVSVKDSLYDALQFPLVHWDGRPTWSPTFRLGGRHRSVGERTSTCY